MGGGRFYDAKFYRELEATRESAREILPMVLDILKPQSIVDIGCGTGHWLAEARDLGVSDVLGLDGEWALKVRLQIPRDKFLAHDLTKPLNLNRKFDLALSLEVAEHLPVSRARDFVQMICGAADKVLFSAAIPGQGGRNHVNEQWPQYWADLFAQFGFDCYDLVRSKVWSNPRVLWYYSQNCFIYARHGVLPENLITAKPTALVHPGLWDAQVARLNSPGKLLEGLVKALASGLRTKWH
ncbi:MAG TPA: class I SAM-dependent methyltransferase [Terriglobales bacterium]|nr:class I SAM-dependent methyltransferase [Terriglobales bacterium]